MKGNKVQEILNSNVFYGSVDYSVSGRAINDLIQAFEDIRDEMRQEYQYQIDSLEEELQDSEIYVRELKSEIEDLEVQLDDLRLDNDMLNQRVYELENK